MLLTENGSLMDFRFIQAAGLIGLSHMAGESGILILGAHAPVGNKQLADLLIHGHQLYISGSPLGAAQPPIIDSGYRAGAVDVLEIQAVLLNNGPGHGGDGGATLIIEILNVIRCLFCHIASSIKSDWIPTGRS